MYQVKTYKTHRQGRTQEEAHAHKLRVASLHDELDSERIGSLYEFFIMLVWSNGCCYYGFSTGVRFPAPGSVQESFFIFH